MVGEVLSEADAEVPLAQAQIEANPPEPADGKEPVEAGIKQGELPQQREAVGPGSFEPAEIDGEAERLLTLRENHRLNGIPPRPFEPAV